MNYEIIVVGGGHAGIEAALAGARMGHKTALISMLAENIGATSCNPAIGGLAKGHLVKEIDALGGQMGLVTDEVGLQFRLLNESKGPAVRGSRAQIDMDRYRVVMRDICLNTPNLEVLQETVEELLIEEGQVRGVVTQLANRYEAPKVILTAGTFLDGTVHVGESQIKAGRFGEFAAIGLSASMKRAGLTLGRLKTGTCPRIDSSTIDYSVMERQEGDANPSPFSFRTDKAVFAAKKQLPCYVTYTNATTHEIIESNFYRAPLFIGQIEGVGPRYCPSIEDKINRFADKERHHLFLEPQTAQHTEIYINGMSTSLPPDVQRDMVRSVRGMENARIVRYGYAIEYDYVDPTQLHHTFETKAITGLYTAGQINGTTGYEEAAAQGLMAGINAALSLEGKAPLVLRRDEAYIGVLIDDLVTKGTKEPYRMFTSRAEYRLMLREENADVRLGHYGHALGLLNDAEFARVEAKKAAIAQGMRLLEETIVTPHKAFLEELASMDEGHITEKMPLLMIAARKSFTLEKLLRLLPQLAHLEESVLSEILVEAKYARYIEKQNEDLVRMKKWLHVPIPADFVYATIDGLSKEIVEKLNAIRPPNLDAASRISGVTPAAIEILQIFLKVQAKNNKV